MFRQASPGGAGGSIYASDSESHLNSSAKFPIHLELPAPLGVSSYDVEPQQTTPRHPLPVYDYPRYEYDSEEEREAILTGDSSRNAKSSPYIDAQSILSPNSPYMVSSTSSPEESLDRAEYLASPLPINQPLSDNVSSIARLPTSTSMAQRQSRGISLVDPGPVAGLEGGMRTVQRHSRRISSGPGHRPRQHSNPASSYPASPSSPSAGPSLPPGASPSQASPNQRQ